MRELRWLVAIFVLVQATTFAIAQTSWVTVSPKDARFTVEMPKKPEINKTRTRNINGRDSKSLMVGCKTDSGVYVAYRVDLPTAIPRDLENRMLDAVRDDFAEEWNGKVLTEKMVKVELRTGRDFTVRAKDEDGTLTLRFRMYLDGKSVYAMLVGSKPDRELPEDAGRFLGSLAIGDEKAKVSTGVEPEPKGKTLPDWGLAIDTDKDCKFTPDGKKSLKVEVPGTWHDLNPHLSKLNAPRVVQTVDGDFTLTVKVVGDFKPLGKPQNPKSVPSVGAGIVVWSNSDNFIRLERFAISRNNKVSPFIAFLERESGFAGAEHNEGYPGGDCYLRMERKGSRIAGSISLDGTKWFSLKPIDTLWQDKLKVGLAVTNSNSEPFNVKFEEFELIGNIAKDKK